MGSGHSSLLRQARCQRSRAGQSELQTCTTTLVRHHQEVSSEDVSTSPDATVLLNMSEAWRNDSALRGGEGGVDVVVEDPVWPVVTERTIRAGQQNWELTSHEPGPVLCSWHFPSLSAPRWAPTPLKTCRTGPVSTAASSSSWRSSRSSDWAAADWRTRGLSHPEVGRGLETKARSAGRV